MLVATVHWQIWLERHRRIFRNEGTGVMGLVQKVRMLPKSWLMLVPEKDVAAFTGFMKQIRVGQFVNILYQIFGSLLFLVFFVFFQYLFLAFPNVSYFNKIL